MTGDASSAPTVQTRTLAATIASDLRAMIQSGEVPVGERLPSTASLTERFGVSRTVVREAIASLQASGMVQPRQGAGVYVLARAPELTLPFTAADPQRVSTVIELLELRAALEIEAAALASQRRSPAQEEAIHEACRDIESLMDTGQMTAQADLTLHLAIADATNNPRFREFLEYMGEAAIPRQALLKDGTAGRNRDMPRDYLLQLQNEHRAIADAISRGDEAAAREAMRTHLKGSQERYRRLLRQSAPR